MQDAARFINTMKQTDGKRLTYKGLIAKPAQPEIMVDEDGVVIE